MARMEGDLGTRLDWVAVDHWDTDNPHTHVVLRGTDKSGQDLVIAGSYIAHGIRQRASEIATRWLGPRTELEIRQSIQREVAQDRWTSLDERLSRLAHEGGVHLRDLPESERLLLLGRLQKLERMELARAFGDGEFRLRRDHSHAAAGDGRAEA
jgi:type IV secretory pathway VirD2 relaxase